MNEIIERYIYDVTRRLPEKEREEVKRELEANITDMLPDNPKEEDRIAVLTKLGAPYILAEQYRQEQRYLISPAMFELYLSVLKTVIMVVAGICACIGAFIAIPSGSIKEIIGTSISMAMEGVLQAIFWITFGFAMTEHYGLNKKTWTIHDLPQIPEQKDISISRSSSIAGIVLSIFFTGLFIMMIVRGEWFFVLVHDSEIINPFSQTALNRCIPYLLILGGLGVITNGLKLYWARWNIPLCIANIINNVVWVCVVIYILYWPDLLNEKFSAFLHNLIGNGNRSPYLQEKVGILITVLVFIIIAVADIGVSVWHTWKGMSNREY